MALRQAVLGMERASFFYGSARVFGGVSFLLDGARTALVGENGAGKSTLLKCLAGELELNGGQLIRSRGLRLGSVPQDVPTGLADRPVRDVLHDALVKVGLADDYWRIDVLLDEIGVEQEILDRPFGTQSGGWQRLLLIAAAAARARLEDKEIRRLEQAAARYKVWAVKNPDLNKRKNAVETRIARIEKERTQTYVARERRLELADGDIDARVALRIAGLDVRAPGTDRKLIAIDRLAVAAGDRIALLGVNGAGKSTLLSVLAGAFDPELEHYDSLAAVRFNPACRLVYFDQSMRDLPLDQSILDYVVDVPGVGEKDAIRYLAPAGFPFAKLDEPIGVLSHGERARLVFLKMKLLRPNMYLLDEPTNHLDIEGQEDLEAQLEQNDVSCLFVSHDRYFTRTAATRFLEIAKGRLVEIDDPDAFFDGQA